jgi:hypothetical protein
MLARCCCLSLAFYWRQREPGQNGVWMRGINYVCRKHTAKVRWGPWRPLWHKSLLVQKWQNRHISGSLPKRFCTFQTLLKPPHITNKTPRLQSTIFWDVTPCSLVEVHKCFVGTFCLHLCGRRLSQARNQQVNLSLLPDSSFDPEDGGDIFLRDVGMSQNYIPLQPTWHSLHTHRRINLNSSKCHLYIYLVFKNICERNVSSRPLVFKIKYVIVAFVNIKCMRQ